MTHSELYQFMSVLFSFGILMISILTYAKKK